MEPWRVRAVYSLTRDNRKVSTMSVLMKMTTICVIAAFATACTKGANEAAGEATDKAVEAQTGATYSGDGPKENQGEQIDAAQKQAAEMNAEGMENTADKVREGAEKKADSMESQADTVRDSGEKKADAIEDQADKIKP
jgi:hypothetical protein